jgi:hypothetical protein
MEIANMMQDEVLRRLNIAVKDENNKGYDQTDVGVFYHAWFAKGRGRHVYMVHAKNPMIQEAVAAALGGDIIPLIDREVYYAASEMELLENGICRFKDKLVVLIQADNDSTLRRKEGRAVWEKTKEGAKKKIDTELMQDMNLVDWAQATNEQHSRRLSEHTALKHQTILAVSEKLKRATALAKSLGKGELAAWALEDKEQVAPHAVELRHPPRRLVKHRVLPVEGTAEYVGDEPPPTGRRRAPRRMGRWNTRSKH